MSLYHEAAKILEDAKASNTSLKSLIFSKKGWKSDAKTLFALTSEAAKWSEVLAEVIEKCEILTAERQLTPALSLVLTYDLLLAKRGIALPANHGLHATISRHKARLTAELTKARIRRGCSSIEVLRTQITTKSGQTDDDRPSFAHPRWIRINTLLTSLSAQFSSTFAEYTQVPTLTAVLQANSIDKVLHIDVHIPNLLAIPPGIDVTRTPAYREGKLILQDKASCFPAYLLDPLELEGDVIDACAAPGNKTTHLAAIISTASSNKPRRILACERDAGRAETLRSMVKRAGADEVVTVNGKQDFLQLDPHAAEFRHVTSLLLDPSCSGSGIIGRDGGDGAGITIHLPNITSNSTAAAPKGKKRKRPTPPTQPPPKASQPPPPEPEEQPPTPTDPARLTSLSNFQLKLLLHAMAFPSAKRISYSTCSVHATENEHVVLRALVSDVARERGWRVLRRKEQVGGMREWGLRGDGEAAREGVVVGAELNSGVEVVVEACVRCVKGGETGTMGFFVCGFVRDGDEEGQGGVLRKEEGRGELEEDEWNGFDD